MNTPHYCFPAVQLALAFNERVPDEEAGRRIKAIFNAVFHDQYGVDEIADYAIDKGTAYLDQRREAAKSRHAKKSPTAEQSAPTAGQGAPTAGKASPIKSKITETEREENQENQETETETETEEEGEEAHARGRESPPLSGSGSATGSGSTFPYSSGGAVSRDGGIAAFLMNPLGALDRVEGWALPDAMAEYCHERGNEIAVNAFKKAVRLDDAKAREKFRQFVGECEAGQEPNNRGAALTARLDHAGLVNGAASRKKAGDVTIRGVRIAGGKSREDY